MSINIQCVIVIQKELVCYRPESNVLQILISCCDFAHGRYITFIVLTFLLRQSASLWLSNNCFIELCGLTDWWLGGRVVFQSCEFVRTTLRLSIGQDCMECRIFSHLANLRVWLWVFRQCLCSAWFSVNVSALCFLPNHIYYVKFMLPCRLSSDLL